MIIIFLLGLNSWGQTPPTVHVQQLDPLVNVDRMVRPGVQVHKLKTSEKRKTPELLTPEFQNKLLIESQLCLMEGKSELTDQEIKAVERYHVAVDRVLANRH